MSEKYQIIETKDFENIRNVISDTKEDSLILLDVDDTIITPKSHIFRVDSSYRNIVDDLKRNQHNIPNYTEMLENWRRTRGLMLVHEDWPDLIRGIKDKGGRIYALTQMHSGRFGTIERMEEWRYNELKKMDILFQEDFAGFDDKTILEAPEFNESSGLDTPSVFFKGYFMTGGHTKGSVAEFILDNHKPSHITFIDDRKDHIENVGKVCRDLGIPYTGIVFRGVDLLVGDFDQSLADFQKQYWFENSVWLEDDEARNVIARNRK